MVKVSTCIVGTLTFISIATWILFFTFDSILEMTLRSQFVLEEGNELWKNWINVPVGLLGYKYYFFEILNPNDVLRGVRVQVRERGPYCFTHRRYKRITGWGANNETVKYMEYKVNYFDPECSGSNTLDDKFTMVNPLFASLGQAISDLLGNQLPLAPLTSPLVYAALNTFLDAHRQSLFMTKSVREVIYGFKVNLLETIETLTTPLRNMGIKLDALPPSPPDNMFGLLYGRNDTPEGEFEIYTGKGSTAKYLGSFKSVKGSLALSWWKGNYCNEIRGGDGSLFPPFTTRSTKLSAFALDVCRSIDFAYKGDGEFKGIKGYIFGLGTEAFASPKTNPNNECFCIHKSKRSRCDDYNGVFDLGGCQSGAPLLLSLPHYLDVFPEPQVDGLAPNRKIHDTYVIIEPTTSAPIYGSKKLMFSLRVENVPNLRNFQYIKSNLIPFVWAEEAGGLTDELAVGFKQIVDVLNSAKSYVLLFAFLMTLITALTFGLTQMCRSKRSKISPEKLRIPSLYDSPVKENTPGVISNGKKDSSTSTTNTTNTSVQTTPDHVTASHSIDDDDDKNNSSQYPFITPKFIASNFSQSPITTPPRHTPPTPPPRLPATSSFTVSRKRRSVSYDETNGSDHLQDNKNQLRLSATSPAEATATDQVYSTDSADKNEDEVYVSDLVKYGELNDSKSNDEKDLLTSQEILDARALISANGSLFEDELSHVKGVTNDDTTSINQDGMFGTLLNEHNSRVNEREQIEASP